MTVREIKQGLETLNNNPGNSFLILKEINALINNKSTEDAGRELVIRALEKKAEFINHEDILNNLVRLVGLFPYLSKNLESLSIVERYAYELHRPVNIKGDFVFHSMQFTIYQELLNGKNIVLSAATSVGKSLIIDALIASQRFKKIVLIVPTIALIDETRQRVSARYRDICKIISHPSQEGSTKFINVYILTQERVIERKDLDDTDIFILDEFYKLDFKMSEDDRVISLNLAFYKMLNSSKQFFLIGPHVDYIKDIDRLGHIYTFVPSSFSTVAVNYHRYNYGRDDIRRNKTLLQLCKDVDGPILIYCQSPNSAHTVADLLLTMDNLSKPQGVDDALEWIEMSYDKEWIFYRAIERGIGIHHGGIPRALQHFCLEKFNGKQLKFLICTTTIIEGVNTVAKNVIVYDNRRNTHTLDYFTYRNIEGRAGRMGQYYVGNVYSLEKAPEKIVSQVDVAVASQPSTVPLSLLLHLNESDLTEDSKIRVRDDIHSDILPSSIIKQNLSFDAKLQYDLAEYLIENFDLVNEQLQWKSFPTNDQLNFTCKLIFDYLGSAKFQRNGILSSDDLDRHIKKLLATEGVDGYLKNRITEEREQYGVSVTIENSLKVIRNVFGFSFPRALRALDLIQKSIFSKKERDDEAGDYNLFAREIENLKLNPDLFALEEFGIPLQTVEKLKGFFTNANSLDDILARLKRIQVNNLNLYEFERTILTKVKKNL